MDKKKLISMEYNPIEYYPGDDVIEEPESIFLHAVDVAKPLEELMFCNKWSCKQLYYSIANDIISENPTLRDKENLEALDRIAVSQMYFYGIPYDKIIESMTYSASFMSLAKKQRWIMSSYLVLDNLNPLLAMPEIMEAKSIFALVNPTPRERYNSYLKYTLEKDPNCSLHAADHDIFTSLKAAGMEEKYIKEIMANSMQFSDELLEGKDIEKAMKEFFEEKPLSREEVKAFNEKIYKFMKNDIANMKEIREDCNFALYWKEVNTVIKKAFRRIAEQQTALKVLNMWRIGLENAIKDLHIEVSDDMQKQMEEMKEAYEESKLQSVQWSQIMEFSSRMEGLFNNILTREMHPGLYSIEEVRKAPNISDISVEDYEKVPRKDLYFAILKEVLRNNPKINIKNADIDVVIYMKNLKLDDKFIADTLIYSKKLAGFTLTMKIKQAKAFVSEMNKLLFSREKVAVR